VVREGESDTEGEIVGVADGLIVGADVGEAVVGNADGIRVGIGEGAREGENEGIWLGNAVGVTAWRNYRIESKDIGYRRSKKVKCNHKTIAIKLKGSRDCEVCAIRWRLLDLSEVVGDSDFILTMLYSASHSGHKLQSISRTADKGPIADAIDAL
jgi:hypothetical protein